MRRFPLSLGLLLIACSPIHAGDSITPAQAATKVGETVSLHMRVRGIGSSSDGFTELLSESEFQHPQGFFVRISPDVKSKLAELKITDVGKQYRNQFIRATGKIVVINFTFGKRLGLVVPEPSKLEIIDPESLEPLNDEITELYKSGKLFQRPNYKEVRAAFAKRFESNHQAAIKSAFGEDYSALNAFFDENKDIKENFYTALSVRYDDIPKALGLFKEIRKRYPDSIKKWNALAIAVAVTWDDPRGIYDYKPHQVRVKSIMPESNVDALANYQYVVDNEKRFPQPVNLYPWEFLTFVVNHRTPLKERNWAFSFFQTAKTTSKSWHKDVPYDFEIIKREINKDPSAKEPRLAGKDYTLANIKQYGGVCAHQADFAARTAQSLGIPAVWCRGTSAYREDHAWWMFVNVASATKDDIKFFLTSDGRFDGKDNFYTGDVLDPQSGMIMLDRDMERRLWLAGTDRVGKRLSHLLMRAYPVLAKSDTFDLKEKVSYLDRVLKVSKYNEDAWIQFAQLAKRGELADENKKIALGHLTSLSQTFERYPDFIWRIFDDLIEVASPDEKVKKYESVLALFEKAKRPDLACDARLKLTELLIAQEKFTSAHSGLSVSIKKFPTEGRYVPKMLKKMEEVSANVKAGPAAVAELYIYIIPNAIVYYKGDNVYIRKMKDQARTYFEANNLTKATARLEAQIVVAQASLTKGKK